MELSMHDSDVVVMSGVCPDDFEWVVTTRAETERNFVTTLHGAQGGRASSSGLFGPMLAGDAPARAWQGRIDIGPELTLARFDARFTSATAILPDGSELPMSTSEAFPAWGLRFAFAGSDEPPMGIRLTEDDRTGPGCEPVLVPLVDPYPAPGGWSVA